MFMFLNKMVCFMWNRKVIKGDTAFMWYKSRSERSVRSCVV